MCISFTLISYILNHFLHPFLPPNILNDNDENELRRCFDASLIQFIVDAEAGFKSRIYILSCIPVIMNCDQLLCLQ